MPRKIKVLFVAAELNPLAKVGGLADVIGALPKALAKLNLDVRIVIPKYNIINEKKYPLIKIVSIIQVPFEKVNEIISLYQTTLPESNIPVYLINHQKYLGFGGVYPSADASSTGSTSEAHRFTFFTRAVLEIFNKLKWRPDIIHCHDWHIGLLPALIKLFKIKMPTLFTIHNLAYQGHYKTAVVTKMLNSDKVKLTDLPSLKERIKKATTINYVEQGILNAGLINTVSPNYAKEILTKEFGCGLEKVLQNRKKQLFGILNGIDLDKFNPENDKYIIENYSINNLGKKIKNKIYLQKICGLEINKNLPLFGLVSRLTEQKGLDLLGKIADKLLKQNCQIVLLGAGSPYYQDIFITLAKKYPAKFYTKIDFDVKLAQEIYAGSDLFLMPSRFEPCGLGQMIAMRYGTLPIARAIGGLKDTVFHLKNGFVFKNYNPNEFYKICIFALKTYQNKKKWQQMMENAMSQNFSWNKSARKYIELYNKLLKYNS